MGCCMWALTAAAAADMSPPAMMLTWLHPLPAALQVGLNWVVGAVLVETMNAERRSRVVGGISSSGWLGWLFGRSSWAVGGRAGSHIGSQEEEEEEEVPALELGLDDDFVEPTSSGPSQLVVLLLASSLLVTGGLLLACTLWVGRRGRGGGRGEGEACESGGGLGVARRRWWGRVVAAAAAGWWEGGGAAACSGGAGWWQHSAPKTVSRQHAGPQDT